MTLSKTKITPDGSSLLKNLLEVKNESNMTALLIGCQLKNPALIELLVEAGANCKALDEKSNTSILLVASSLAKDSAPTKELCPSIFKVIYSFFLASLTFMIRFLPVNYTFPGLPKAWQRS